MGREVAGAHLAVRLLVDARRALALEAPHQEVNAGAAVLADPRDAASRAGGQLTVLACRQTDKQTGRNPGLSLQLTQKKHTSWIFISSLSISPPPRANISMTPPPWAQPARHLNAKQEKNARRKYLQIQTQNVEETSWKRFLIQKIRIHPIFPVTFVLKVQQIADKYIYKKKTNTSLVVFVLHLRCTIKTC